ncbi:MAG: hypothetical protein DDT22_00259 [candidate division WS2 bacterium]|nr:hypothetical protein [Candidatus Lithacetigena glycinireducens]MBT9174599.1 hypothetical protein [Candidatus Lithacetigena glycinireducens]
MNAILKTLQSLLYIIPSLIKIIIHYNELVTVEGKLQPEDKNKAIALLESLRWKPFGEIGVKEEKNGR